MVNINLWGNFLNGRTTQGNFKVGEDGRVHKKVADGETDADGDGFNDTAVAGVDLSDGLSATELQTLTGSAPAQIDQVIDDGWDMSGPEGFEAITEADLNAAETGMFAWAEAHGLPHESDAEKGQIRSLYYSQPDALHSENSATISQSRTTAQEALQNAYTTWQGLEGNSGKTFTEYLAAQYPQLPEPMKSADSPTALIRLAFLSTFDSSAQEAYGLTPTIAQDKKYAPSGEGFYLYANVETWLTSFAPAPAEEAEVPDQA